MVARGRAPRLRARGARDRRRAVDPGLARAPGGAARARPTSCTAASTSTGTRPAVDRRPVGPPPRAASGRCRATSSAGCAATEFLNYLRVREWQDLYSQLRQVAGELGIRAGTEARPSRPRAPVACWPGCCRTSACATGESREFRGARAARVHDRARVGARQEAAAVGDGGRAGRDEPAVGPAGRDGRSRSGPSGSAPHLVQALVRRAALGRARGAGRHDRDGDAVRAADRRPAARSATTASTRRRRGRCSSATPWSRASGPPHHAFLVDNERFRDRVRRCSRRVCAAATCSTTRCCSTSTTSGSATTSSSAPPLRPVVEGAAQRSRPADLTERRCRVRTAGSTSRLPRPLAPGRPRATAVVPLRPGRAARRRVGAPPADGAQPGHRRRLRLAVPGHRAELVERARAVAAEGRPRADPDGRDAAAASTARPTAGPGSARDRCAGVGPAEVGASWCPGRFAPSAPAPTS